MMYDSMFTGVTQENFEDRVEIFISSTFPTFKSYDAAAHEFVSRLENKDLGLLADSSDSYEFDEMYLMSEIKSRTGAEWDTKRYGEYYFDEEIYQAVVEGLINGMYDKEAE